LNQKTHASTQTDILVPCIPKDSSSSASLNLLSQLLSQARYVVQELELVELKIVEQPQEFWRKRSINCLRNKWCPAIQGRSGKQRRYIGIKVRFQINYLINLDDFLFDLYLVAKIN